MALSAHILPALVICFAAFMQAITGFGLVIIAAPLLMMFYDPKETVLIMFIVALFMGIAQSVVVRKDAQYKIIAAILIGYILAQPAGFYIYHTFSNMQLKVLIGAILLVSLLAMQFTHYRFRLCLRNHIAAGILAGISGVTLGMAGPPLILYFAYTDLTPDQLRGTSVIFFLISGVISIVYFLFQGVDMEPALIESVYMIPALVIGLCAGQYAYKYVSPQLFRKLMFIMLYFVCLYTFYSVFFV